MNAGGKSKNNSDTEQTSDDGILEIYTGKVEMTLSQVEKVIDMASVMGCSECGQIGRSFRKMKDLPPTFKCESCAVYLCA